MQQQPYAVEWTAEGSVTVLAYDRDEAEAIVMAHLDDHLLDETDRTVTLWADRAQFELSEYQP